MQQLQQFQRIHFIGIGGAGMSAIASVLLSRGYQVQGSDAAESATTRKLAAAGAGIFIGHVAENIAGADLVVTSTAIQADNPERLAACEAGVPIWRRARVLAEIMRAGRAIAISGTHGKTTTTSMIGTMLATAEWDPTVLIGGEVNDFGGNARSGGGEWVVAEADESDASFLEMEPDRIIITNIEADHLDFYADLAEIERTFEKFCGRIRPGGVIVACIDSPAVARLIDTTRINAITYSISNPGAQIFAIDIEPAHHGRGTRFTPVWRGVSLPPVELKIPGRHNVSNALAALAVGLDIGVPFEPMRRALANFIGARRRFQVKGESDGVTIVDDYAHHPTEIAATLSAARGTLNAAPADGSTPRKRLVGIFQPHRFSRTQALADDFGQALLDTDLLVVTDVYSAGEAPIPGISGELIFRAAVGRGHANAHYCPTLAEARNLLGEKLGSGDLFLTLGAGNIHQLGENLLLDLAAREEAKKKAELNEVVA